MPHLSERLAMLESASAPKEKPKTGLMKTHLTGEAFKAKMAEGKARAKAKREALGEAKGKMAVPEAPLIQEHKDIPGVLTSGSPAERKEEAEHQSAEGAELRQESATGVSCPTCGTKVAGDSLKKRKAGLQRKAQMAKEIADQANSHASLIDG